MLRIKKYKSIVSKVFRYRPNDTSQTSQVLYDKGKIQRYKKRESDIYIVKIRNLIYCLLKAVL